MLFNAPTGHVNRTCREINQSIRVNPSTAANTEPLYRLKQSFFFRCSRYRRVVVCLNKFYCVYVRLKKNFLARDTLKGHCHAIWQLYKRLEGAFASIEFQN